MFFILVQSNFVYCDYDCVCNYAVETSVFSTPDLGGQPIGYLYEFDCKPKASGQQAPNNFYAIQFEKQLGYVKTDPTQLQIQTCPGDPPDGDLIPTTTGNQNSATTVAVTTTVDIATTTLPAASLSTMSSVQTTTSSATSITTRSTTPIVHWYSANVTGTPYEYIGVGYNILMGNPESRTDPGLNTAARIFQLTGDASSVREATYQTFKTCTPANSTFILHGSKTYQDELKAFVKTSSSHIQQVEESAFIYSPDFQAFRRTLDDASVVYLDFVTACKLGSARYLTENADKNGFTVSLEFAKDVCALPTQFNSSAYMHFLDKWGTSIVTGVDMGTSLIERYKTTPDQLLQHAQQTQPDILEHSGSYQGYPSSITINTKDYANTPAGSAKFGVAQQISKGSNSQPVPIALKVIPIYNALNWSYWQPIIDQLTAEGICSDSVYGTGMNHYAANMKAFLSQYSEYKATGFIHTALTDYQIKVPLTWPVGTYGLMQTSQGCPGANSHWSTGWRMQDTEDLRAHNTYSPGINTFLKGEFASNNIKTYFCIKTSQSTSSYDQTWQNGTYCLLKHGTCPTGFTSGFVYWDDEDLNNDNSKGGTLPDGTYDKNTKIYYCCRNDASPQIAVFLPTDRPFILLRYGNTCQTVHGMHVRDLFVKWDDEDLRNKDKTGGMHPLDDGGSGDHKLHFCYYYSSNRPSIVG